MLKKLLTDKKKLSLIVLILLSTLALVWILLISKGGVSKPTNTPLPVKFSLVKTIPESGSINSFPATTAIEFDFSKPIDINTLTINSIPKSNITFETDQNDTSLFIRSIDGWSYGTTYEITISVMSKDKEGPEKITLTFKTNLPKSSNLDEVPR